LSNRRRVVPRAKISNSSLNKVTRVKIVIDGSLVKSPTAITAVEKAPEHLTMKEKLAQDSLTMVEDNKITTMSEGQSLMKVKLACERRLKRNSKE